MPVVGPISSYIGRRTPYVVSPPGVYAITDEPQAIHLHALFALSEPQVRPICKKLTINHAVHSFHCSRS